METSKAKEALCPGCGREVDPLRAGHVSIDALGFRYFCGLDCKRAYVEVASKRSSVDALTAEPPRVSSRVTLPESAVERLVGSGDALASSREPHARVLPDVAMISGPRSRAHDEVESEASLGDPSGADDATASSEAASGAWREGEGEGEGASHAADDGSPASGLELAGGDDADDEESPSTLRSPTSSARPSRRRTARGRTGAVARSTPRDGFAQLVVPAAIASGVLSALVALAGEWPALRLVLALVAVGTLFVWTAVRKAKADGTLPWIVALPSGTALLLALLAHLVRHPNHGSFAAFAGLSAATTLVVDRLFARARRDVVEIRERAEQVLSGSVQVVVGDDADATRGEHLTGEVREVSSSEVRPGETIVARAGETVRVDGIVAAGTADVAPWLDASVATTKQEGDAVVAGATVLAGRLRITATFAGADRAWLRDVGPGAGRKGLAPSLLQARFALERGVPVAALLLGALSYFLERSWFDAAIAACAGGYALSAVSAVLALGLAYGRGQSTALRRGIVYKDGRAFDMAARAEVAVVCSRGTLLLGEPEIVAVEATSGRDTARVLALAAGARSASRGAESTAIAHEARARGIKPEPVRSVLVQPGLGVTALVGSGEQVACGSRAFMLKEKVSVAAVEGRVAELEAQGRSVLLVALGGRLVGLLALQDGIRVGARAAVQRMHDARIEPVLLSSESRATCTTIARSLDIDHVRPEVLPGDKETEVRSLVEGGRTIAVIGHPASDDAALAAGDIAVAMGAAGLAPGGGEWGIALASDDVRDAALALTIPRACRERTKKVLLVCAGSQVGASMGIALGVFSPVLAPVVGLLASAIALAFVREPTTTLPASYT